MHKNMKVIISSERIKMLMIPLVLTFVLSACGGGSSSTVSVTGKAAPATAPSLSVIPQTNFTSTSGGVDVNAVNRSIDNFNAGK